MTPFGWTELNRVQAEEAVECHPEVYIAENLEVVRKRFRSGQVKRLTPYTLKALEQDFRATTSALEQERTAGLAKGRRVLLEEENVWAAEEALFQAFEDVRSKALAHATANLITEELNDGFESFVKAHHRFSYDYVLKHEGTLIENLEHAMIRPLYHQFLANKLLSDKFHSFDAWREG